MKVVLVIVGSWINILLIVAIANLFRGHKAGLITCLILGFGLLITSYLCAWNFILLAFGVFNLIFSLFFIQPTKEVDDIRLLDTPQEKSGVEYHPKFKS
jgi:hypothetical protein